MSSKKEPVKKEEAGNSSQICENRRARFEYHLQDKFEAGMVLTGNEIKAIRDKQISIDEAFVRPINGEVFLMGAHIREYKYSSATEYNPTRVRKLLLHQSEIEKLIKQVEAKGMTIVPLRVYINKRGKAKLEIALAKGKDAPDKRKATMDREKKREAERALKFSK